MSHSVRLACVNVTEVRTVVKKIITYETTTYGSEWFKKMTVISGDGFLDQEDLNIQWDTNGLPTGSVYDLCPEQQPIRRIRTY